MLGLLKLEIRDVRLWPFGLDVEFLFAHQNQFAQKLLNVIKLWLQIEEVQSCNTAELQSRLIAGQFAPRRFWDQHGQTGSQVVKCENPFDIWSYPLRIEPPEHLFHFLFKLSGSETGST